MFDCSWVEPPRETVGQRKDRKDQQSNSLSRKSSRPVSASSSPSTQKSSTRKIFGLKRREDNYAKAQDKPPPLLSDGSESVRRMPSLPAISGPSHEPHISTARSPRENFFSDGPPSTVDGETRYSPTESVFSGRTGRSATTDSTWGSIISTVEKEQLIQSLSPTSFVTRSTKATISLREGFEASEQTGTFVHIYSDGTLPPGERPPMADLISPMPFESPMKNENKPPPSILEDDMVIQSIGLSMPPRKRQANVWKAPEAWEYMADEQTAPTLPSSDSPAPMQQDAQTDLLRLQKSIRKMEAASQEIVLERLKEEWLEVVDASMRQELELEKQLWMLTAMRTVNKKKSSTNTQPTLDWPTPIGASKVLSLHQNHAFTSSLSALTPSASTQVHHLSTKPLSPHNYPNIHPLTVPRATAQLPYASSIFSSIHAFSLPAFLPSWSIPRILKECHRCLSYTTPSLTRPVPSSPTTSSVGTITGGTLHLTLLDPSPLLWTLGPKLRSWLDTNLILGLEKQFLCINPSRLFPIWLADASLMGEGSTIVTRRFLASTGQDIPDGFSSSGGETNASQQVAVTEELKSRVGRMLWKEMWGSYVKGDKWWWDDESILEECKRIGTVWEYSVIEAVKEG